MLADLLDRFLRPLRRPPLTAGYPETPLAPAATVRGLPELRADRCDGSADCVRACPTDALSFAERTWTLDVGRCVFCGDCARACPRDALRLGPRQELAALDRDALVIVVPVGSRP